MLQIYFIISSIVHFLKLIFDILSANTNSNCEDSLLTHISCPREAFSVVAHQCHETCDKLVPLCVSTGTTWSIVDVVPLNQNLKYNRNRMYHISQWKVIFLFN